MPPDVPRTIDFGPYIRERSQGFTGREWVFAKIETWLRQTKSRYFLITGVPGSGKTAISAYLAGLSRASAESQHDVGAFVSGCLSAVHFCRATDLRWCDPRVFAESISHQLARRYPVYADALKGGLKPLVVLNIHQHADTQIGDQIGAIIHDFSFAEDQVFASLFREPIEALIESAPGTRLTILIDGIDESRIYSRSRMGIPALISRLDQLSANVRFILTSRPDAEIEAQFGGAALVISSEKHVDDNRRDLERYVEMRLGKTGAMTSDLIVLRSRLLSKKNFLYIKFALNLIDSVGVVAADLGQLPNGLDKLLSEWLQRILAITTKDWEVDYAPVLGVIMVAREALSLHQLLRITRQRVADLRSNLLDLGPLLQGGEDGYAIYHEMIGDLLRLNIITTENGEVANLYCLPKHEQHERITESYRGGCPWAEVNFWKIDDYGLRYLAGHLAELSRACGDGSPIYEYICRNLLLAKRERFKSDTPFVEDVRLSIAVARAQSPPDYDQIIRGFQIIAELNFFASRIPSQAVVALAWSKKTPQALAWAALRQEPWDYIEIARASLAHGNLSIAREAIDKSIDIALSTRESAPIGAAVELLYQVGDRKASSRLAARLIARQNSWAETDRAIVTIADVAARTGDLGPLRRAIAKIRTPRVESLLRTHVAAALLNAGKKRQAERWLKRAIEDLGNDSDAVIARCAIAIVLARLGRRQDALEAARTADRPNIGCEEHVAALLDPLETAFFRARDDSSGRLFGYAIEAAIRAGALDLAATEIKKRVSKAGKDGAWLDVAREAARLAQCRIVFDCAGAIDDFSKRLEAGALAGRALARVEAGDFEAAGRELKGRLHLTKGQSEREAILAALAYGLARHGRSSDAVAVAEECIDMCRIKGNRTPLVKVVVAIAECLATHGHAEAKEVARLALRLAARADGREHGRYARDVASAAQPRVQKLLLTWRVGTDKQAVDHPDFCANHTRASWPEDNQAASLECRHIQDLVRKRDTYALQTIGAQSAEQLGADFMISTILGLDDDFSRRSTLGAITAQLIERNCWVPALEFSMARLAIEAEGARLHFLEGLEADVPVYWMIDQGRTLKGIAKVIEELENW